MISLTVWVKKVDAGFKFSGSRDNVNHVLFLNGLKLYEQKVRMN